MFGQGKLSEEGEQGYEPVASQPSEWASYPGSSEPTPPPMVSATPSSSSQSATDWWGMASSLGRGLVDIFGRPVQQQYQPPPPQPGIPLWGWVAIGVGGVVVLGVLARSMRRPATAGYRRHRRSRR
jgi:hypothetical protein